MIQKNLDSSDEVIGKQCKCITCAIINFFLHALVNGYFRFELEADMGVSENGGKQSIPMINNENIKIIGAGLL